MRSLSFFVYAYFREATRLHSVARLGSHSRVPSLRKHARRKSTFIDPYEHSNLTVATIILTR